MRVVVSDVPPPGWSSISSSRATMSSRRFIGQEVGCHDSSRQGPPRARGSAAGAGMTLQGDDPDKTSGLSHLPVDPKDKEPKTELHPGFSADDATATPWAEARGSLELADLSWLTTVRPDGRPHVTPLIFVWLEGAVFFVTGPEERKAKNLTRNPHCIITTGCNSLQEGLDVVVEGEAVLVSDPARLQQVADEFAAKYVPREGAKGLAFRAPRRHVRRRRQQDPALRGKTHHRLRLRKRRVQSDPLALLTRRPLLRVGLPARSAG